jgi:inosine-uridine nucleoside N-ribohydrolase
MSRPFLIDTDTASDDAVGHVMALRDPELDVVGITVVAGNVGPGRAERALHRGALRSRRASARRRVSPR